MRKIYFLFCLLILAGCSKKAAVSPTSSASVIVTYNFKASVNGAYSLYYDDPYSPKQTEVQFNGTSWSKSDTVKTGSYAEGATFRIELSTLSLAPGAAYSITISVNDKVVSSGNYTPNTLFAYVSYDYPVYH